MKNSLKVILMISVSTFAVVAQNSKDEQEVLKVHNSLNQAYLNKDITVFERVLADDFVYSGQNGKMSNRAQNLDVLRQLFTNSDYKELGLTNQNLKAKVSGNMAFVTGNWTLEGVAADDANAEPHRNTGRLTAIYEKRRGKWQIVAEHYSEASRDRKLMEQQVLKAGRSYFELMKRLTSGLSYSELEKSGEIPALKRLLADEFTYISPNGEVFNKSEELQAHRDNQSKVTSAELSEQKVRVVSNNSAVETGKIRFVGATAGKPFDVTKRYTTTWIWRDSRWQIVSDHGSAVKQ